MKSRLLCAALVCAAVCSAAQASPIVFNWQGTALMAIGQYGIKVGDAYSGSVTFDPATAQKSSSSIYGSQGYQWYSGNPMSVTVNAGTLHQTVNVQTMIANNYYGSIDDIEFYNGSTNLGYFNLQLQDVSGRALSGFSLPTASLDFSAFPTHRLMLFGQDAANITSFSAANVPEPATLGLLTLGLAAVAVARRRKPQA